MKELTKQQSKVLACVEVYLNKTGFPPTRAEICKELGFKSPSDTLQFTAKALADRWETKEAQLGIDAFLNKEKPPWGK